MRTHIKTKYSDFKEFEESYALFIKEFEKDEKAKRLLRIEESNCIRAHAFYCEECGHEYYVDWRDRYIYFHDSDYVDEYKKKHIAFSEQKEINDKVYDCKIKYRKFACVDGSAERTNGIQMDEYDEFCKSDKTCCPICGTQWKPSPQTYAHTKNWIGNFVSVGAHSDEAHRECINRLFKEIEQARMEANKIMAEEKMAALESSLKELTAGCVAEPAYLESPKELMKYISKILTLETNLVSLKKWLETLYLQEPDISKAAKEHLMFTQKEIADKLKEQKRVLEELKNTDAAAKVTRRVIERKEASYPEVPREPIYEKVGLFNKKKVESENAQKRQSFEMAKMEYDRALIQCAHQQKIFDDEYAENVKQAEAEYLRNCEEARLCHEKEIQKCKAEIEKLEQEIEKYSEPEFLENTAEKVLKNIVDANIAQAEDLIKRTYEARERLYNYNIIFGKYRNPVALATFYEYLMSGRCSTLDGPAGAYNLYEAEIRANMIICQLSEVIDNLEKIRENQFTIYSQLSNMNQSLDRLNSTMESAVVELEAIKDNTTVVAENTAVIAHNTAVTAYYSKKTAELTDALGFMVALK